jgi:uncharacterized protein (DUF433 family)
MAIPQELAGVLTVNPQVMHGKLCFAGTRVPLTVLLDNLAEGMGLEEFIAEYPSVTREQAQTVIRWEQRKLRELLGL